MRDSNIAIVQDRQVRPWATGCAGSPGNGPRRGSGRATVTTMSNGNSFSEANSYGLGTEVREPWLIRVTAGNGDGWR